MGRTIRKRKQKQNLSYTLPVSLDHQCEIVSLNKWIKANGFMKCKKICLADFQETGRGVRAIQNIAAGDVLLEVPFKLILNMHTLQKDADFIKIFLFYKNNAIVAKMFNCQEILSFYIAYLKIREAKHTFWSDYIHTLPKKFQMPFFCTNNESNHFDDSVRDITNNQKTIVELSFRYFKNLLLDLSSMDIKRNDYISHLILNFTQEVYEWAYFTVNSRCIYLDPEIIKNILDTELIKSDFQFSFSEYLKDSPSLGLIPYLDMFNHSLNIKTIATLTVKSKSKGTSALISRQFDTNDLYFTLKTLSVTHKYNQVFISYGENCNLKLYTEYGFSLPLNYLTNVTFSFSSICETIKNQKDISLSKEKYLYILKHGINKHLSLTHSGFSYNFLRLLFILVNNKKNIWDSKIYSNNYNDMEISQMSQVSKIFLQEKYDCITAILNKSIKLNPVNISFHMFISLMKEYLTIITMESPINV